MKNSLTANNIDIKIFTPLVALGLLYYPLNKLTDRALNIPVGDLLLPLALLYFALKTNTFSKIIKIPATWWALAFITWVFIANMTHGIGLGNQGRMLYVLSTLFLPVLCFITLPDEYKDKIIKFMIGAILGFGFFFIFEAAMEIANGSISRTLRGIQPTPVVAFAFWAMFRDRMSNNLKILTWFTIIVSILVGIAIEARGPLLAVVMMVGFSFIAKLGLKQNIFLIIIMCASLMAHFITGIIFPDMYYAVIASDNNTLSNRERAYLIDFCLMMIKENPWFGMSFREFAMVFADYFSWIDNFRRDVDAVKSPHNSFLEYATFYGLPAAFLFMSMLISLFRNGLRLQTNIWIKTAIIAGIIRLGAFYGFSGWLRIEWFALMFLLYYSMQRSSAKPSVKLR